MTAWYLWVIAIAAGACSIGAAYYMGRVIAFGEILDNDERKPTILRDLHRGKNERALYLQGFSPVPTNGATQSESPQ